MLPNTAYHPVTSSAPSSEHEEAVVDEKDEWGLPRAPTWTSRAWRSVRSKWWIVDTFLLLIILALVVEPRFQVTSRREKYQLGGDITGFAPPFSQQLTKFQPDLSFVPENTSEFWTDAVLDRWLSIVPKGLGYLHIEDPAAYDNVPNPIDDYTNMTVLTTSMPHQLHCLYNILAVYSAMTSENPKGIPTEMTFHLQHCFEYLRLSIMCCGDVALEGAETTFPEGFGGSDGWDAVHVCKNYEQVYDYMEENRATDRLWIGVEPEK